MTIAKRLGASLLLAALCLVGSGCGARETDFPFEALLPAGDTETAENGAETARERGYYRIIIPADASSELMAAARELADRIEDATERYVYVLYDSDPITLGSATDIFLGNTDRALSQMVLGGLRDGEYLCRVQDGVIVLGGRSEAATLAAIEKFCAEWLPYATSEQLMRPDGGFFYPLPEERRQLLNGYPLSEYCVILSDDAPSAVSRLAAVLQSSLSDGSGFSLPVFRRSEYSGGKRQIVLEVASAQAERRLAQLIPDERGIVLRASEPFGVSVAIRALCAELTDGADYSLTSPRSIAYEEPKVRVASVMANHLLPFGTPGEVTAVTAPVMRYGADCVLFGEQPVSTVHLVTNNLSPYVRLDENGSKDTVVPVYAKGGMAESDTLSAVGAMGTLPMTVCRVGNGETAFLLVRISGVLTESRAAVLSSALADRGLPVMILLHTESSGGSLAVSVRDYATELYLTQTYTVRDRTYTLACYGTADAFLVASGNADDSGGYRDVVIERVSVFG